MATLNLEPNLTIMGIQTGIFLTNMFVVKKLMLEPYLKVKQSRDLATTGSTKEAELLAKKAADGVAELNSTVNRTRAECSESLTKSVNAAIETQEAILAQAKSAVDAKISATEQALSTRIEEEDPKIEEAVRRLAEEMTVRALAV